MMSSDTGDIALSVNIVSILVLALLQALTAASKRALDNTDRNRIKEMCEDEPDNRLLNRALRFLQKPSEYHYADLFAGYVFCLSSFLIFDQECVREVELKQRVIYDILYILVYIGVTSILPKKIAVQSGDRIGASLAGFQSFIYIITLPFVKCSLYLANFILVILRKKTDVDNTYFSEEKVLSMIDQGQETGDIKEEAHRMIDSIFEFDDLLAYEIMTPRTDIFMIDIDDDREEYFDELMEMRYSRIPVYEDDSDNIIGILHIKDYLLQATKSGFDDINIRELLREPYFVPETKNIDSLFVELQKTKNHIAILIDEYGGVSGLVSIEDIIEQIVGDIDDEFDEDDHVIEKLNDHTYIVDGNVYLDDLDEETGIELESDTSETIGGFLIDRMGEIPKEHARYQPIRYDHYSFQILEVKDRRIVKVRIEILDESESEMEEQ